MTADVQETRRGAKQSAEEQFLQVCLFRSGIDILSCVK